MMMRDLPVTFLILLLQFSSQNGTRKNRFEGSRDNNKFLYAGVKSELDYKDILSTKSLGPIIGCHVTIFHEPGIVGLPPDIRLSGLPFSLSYPSTVTIFI